MPESRFTGKTVVIAGGTGALGRVVCHVFASEGANVITTYRSEPEYQSLAASAAADGWKLQGERVDVTDEAAAAAFIGRLASGSSGVYAIVNCVGGYMGGSKLWQADSSALDRMLSGNLRSIYSLSRAAIPAMLDQKGGCLVNVAAKAGLDHPAGSAAYAASKAAAISLMATLAAEVKGTGVRVNSILPDTIDTEANRRAMPKAAASGKWASPEDIARVILFLCSDDARVIHGASIPVYGS